MKKKDGLRYAIGRANLTGSYKTQHNHKQEAHRFIDALRTSGQGVSKWTNVTNKHVSIAVAHWEKCGLSCATVKNYLSGVRSLCRAYGNDRIERNNSSFGVFNRTYVDGVDKSVSDAVYSKAVTSLEASGGDLKGRVALMLQLQRKMGVRLEESVKFNPLRDDQGKVAHIHIGTKGGRPRWTSMNDEQRNLMEVARESGFYRRMSDSIIPAGWTERKWINQVYKAVASVGLTKETGGTMHGLRHAYAQDRFQALTGFEAPVKFDSIVDYQANAYGKVGDEFQTLQDKARHIISEELGHSRIGIVAQYLGSF